MAVSQDFHSFRRTFLTMLENAGIAEGVAADIVGSQETDRFRMACIQAVTTIEVMREACGKDRLQVERSENFNLGEPDYPIGIC